MRFPNDFSIKNVTVTTNWILIGLFLYVISEMHPKKQFSLGFGWKTYLQILYTMFESRQSMHMKEVARLLSSR